MLNDDNILTIIRDELHEAQGYDSDVLSSTRANALRYYHGEMADTPEGRSQIVSYDVADTVHALMSQTGEIFRASSVEFDAENEEDEPQAQLESDFIIKLMEKNDEYATFDASVFDALLQGNGWIEVDVKEDTLTTVEKYENITPEEAAFIMQPESDNQEIEITQSDKNGDTVSFTLKRITTKQSLSINSISPDVMLFSQSADQFSLNEIRFIAKRHYMSVTDLINEGLTLDEATAIPDSQDEYWEASVAREGKYGDTSDELSGNQEATQLKETFICWIMLDEDESGQAVRKKVHIAGSHIIANEFAPWIPFVTGSPLPMPHRIQGQGMYEIMKQVQDSKTGILRSYMDNLAVMNMSRVGYLKGEVDMEELLNGRINGAVGMERPDALIPLPSNDIGSVAITGLQYLDSVRTSRGGAALDLNNSEMQVAGSSAAAATREYQSKEQMAGLYCKNLAHTLLKGVFLMTHQTLKRFFNEPMDAKIKGKWVQTNPSEWQSRQHANLLVGLTNSEKQAKLSGLSILIEKQQQWLALGQEGIITDKSKIYNAAADWVKASNIGQNPEEYLIDPNSEEAQQAAQQQQQSQQQQMQQQQQQQEEILALQKELEEMKDATDRYKVDTQTQFDYYKTNIEAQIKEAELTVQGLSMGQEDATRTDN